MSLSHDLMTIEKIHHGMVQNNMQLRALQHYVTYNLGSPRLLSRFSVDKGVIAVECFSNLSHSSLAGVPPTKISDYDKEFDIDLNAVFEWYAEKVASGDETAHDYFKAILEIMNL